MSGNAAEVTLRLRDTGVGAGVRALENQIRQTESRFRELASAGKLSQKDLAAAAVATRTKVEATRKEIEKMQAAVGNTAVGKYAANMEARRTLGIRSEKDIQREIAQTESAYKRLATSGVLSVKELARAQAASTAKVRELRKELGEAEKSFGRISKLAGVGLVAGASVTALAAKRAFEQNMSLDERLGLRANAAYRGKSFEERRQGEDVMRGGIKQAVAGGLTTDEAMDTLDELIAKNQVGGVDKAVALLPKIAQFKTGQGGNAVEAASLVSTLIGSGFAKNTDEAMKQMDMIAGAGGAGAFETADFAKHLPNLLNLAKGQGYVGNSGLKRVLVMLEQGMTTSGSADESANNLKNLFSKMNSQDTANDFKKMGRGDLSNTMLKARAAGKTPDEVYLEVIEQETKNNPKLRAALKSAAAAKDETEREERIKAVNELAKGQAIGKLFQDMQAKGAFMALLNDAFGKEVATAIDKSSGVVEKDAQYIQQKTGFKTRVAGETGKLAQMDAMSNLNPIVGQLAEGFTRLTNEYPTLMGSMTLATGAISGLGVAAASAATGLAAMVMSGGKGGGAVPGVLSNLSRLPGKIPRSAKIGGVAGVAALAGGYALSAGFGEESAVSRYGSAALNGASIGATVGSIVPGLGTGVGAAVGGGIGLLYQGIKDALKASDQKPVDVNANMTVGLAPGLVLQNQSMQATGGNVKLNTGNVWNGAPS